MTEQKKEPPKAKKVADAIPKKKKPSDFEKVLKAFFPMNGKDVKEYIIYDVIVPNARKSANTMISMAADYIFGSGSTVSQTIKDNTYINYDKKSQSTSATTQTSTTPVVQQSGYQSMYQEQSVRTRPSADAVLESMNSRIKEYGFVTVADYYDLLGISTYNTQQCKFGWKTLVGASVYSKNGEWVVHLPKPIPLD